MGKNSAVKTLGRRIGNVVLHSLLVKHTNKPEFTHHLQSEEDEYRNSAIRESKEYHWNEKDKIELKAQALNFIKSKKEQKYQDVNFSIEKTIKLVEEEIKSLFGVST